MSKSKTGAISEEMTHENRSESNDEFERRTYMKELDMEHEELTKTWKLEKSGDKELRHEIEITRIFCRENRPYKITGNGSRYKIIFEGIEEGEIIMPKELMRICQENGLNYNVIFE